MNFRPAIVPSSFAASRNNPKHQIRKSRLRKVAARMLLTPVFATSLSIAALGQAQSSLDCRLIAYLPPMQHLADPRWRRRGKPNWD